MLTCHSGRAKLLQSGKETHVRKLSWLLYSAQTIWEKCIGEHHSNKGKMCRSKPWVLRVFQLRKASGGQPSSKQQAAAATRSSATKDAGTRLKFYLLQHLLLPDLVSGRDSPDLGMQILPILSNSQPCFEQDAGLGDLLGFVSNRIHLWSPNPNLHWTNLCHKADSVRKAVSSAAVESNWCQ